jgi:hypothetical protein
MTRLLQQAGAAHTSSYSPPTSASRTPALERLNLSLRCAIAQSYEGTGWCLNPALLAGLAALVTSTSGEVRFFSGRYTASDADLFAW